MHARISSPWEQKKQRYELSPIGRSELVEDTELQKKKKKKRWGILKETHIENLKFISRFKSQAFSELE